MANETPPTEHSSNSHWLASVLAHEIQNPLAVVASLCFVAERSTQQGSRVEPALFAKMRTQVERTQQIVSDVLALERRPLPSELLTLPEVVLEHVAQRADAERFVLRVHCDAAAPVHANGHRGLLQRLLSVLLDNALSARGQGLEVDVTLAKVGHKAHLTFADNGPGVPLGIDVFARGVSGHGSTGLGLAFARVVAEAHGGTLELLSPHAAPGAHFVLSLPLPLP
jgi:two-component system, OmpR family, sensor kinase